MPRCGSGVMPRAQRGMAFLAFVGVVGALALVLVIRQSNWQAKQQAGRLEQTRLERVERTRERVAAWYAAHLAEADTADFALTGDDLLDVAGVPAQWGLHAGISDLLARDRLRFRVVAIWADGEDGQEPAFDPATGVLALCPDSGLSCIPRASARFESYALQADHYTRTVKQLSLLALAAQSFFKSHQLADPDHNRDLNYFRHPHDPSCSTAAPASVIPCMEGWVNVSATALLSTLAQPGSLAIDAWGNPLQASNRNPSAGLPTLPGSDPERPPYRLAFKAQTPWGEPLLMYALQPL